MMPAKGYGTRGIAHAPFARCQHRKCGVLLEKEKRREAVTTHRPEWVYEEMGESTATGRLCPTVILITVALYTVGLFSYVYPLSQIAVPGVSATRKYKSTKLRWVQFF